MTSQLKFKGTPAVGSGKNVFKSSDPLYSKFFVHCDAWRPHDDQDEEPGKVFLHKDGRWMDTACSASGETGYFDSRDEAEAAIQQAQQ